MLVAFIDLFRALGVPGAHMTSFQDVLAAHPRHMTTLAGKRANTLIVSAGKKTLSLRPFYNDAERFYRAEHKRFDYPNPRPARHPGLGRLHSLAGCTCDVHTAADDRSARASECIR